MRHDNVLIVKPTCSKVNVPESLRARMYETFCQAISHPIRSNAANSCFALTDFQRLMPPKKLW
jgi:hypothetical protein